MAKILLIETATEVCSIGIAVDGALCVLKENLEKNKHTEVATLLIEACCVESGISLKDLDAIALSKGPGSYTSLRVGTSIAKGICYALNKPLIAISTLQALAQGSHDTLSLEERQKVDYYVPMLDARRMEVYTAVFDANLELIQPEQAHILTNKTFYELGIEKNDVLKRNSIVISGSGMKKIELGMYNQELVNSEIQFCSASHLAYLSEKAFLSNDYQSVAYFSPLYIKFPNITKAKNKFF